MEAGDQALEGGVCRHQEAAEDQEQGKRQQQAPEQRPAMPEQSNARHLLPPNVVAQQDGADERVQDGEEQIARDFQQSRDPQRAELRSRHEQQQSEEKRDNVQRLEYQRIAPRAAAREEQQRQKQPPSFAFQRDLLRSGQRENSRRQRQRPQEEVDSP